MTPSLTRRLIVAVFVTQPVLVVAGFTVWITIFTEMVSWDHFAFGNAASLVHKSVVPAEGGGWRIAANPRLDAYAARRPGFQYGAYDRERRTLLAGGADALSELLTKMDPYTLGDGRQVMDDGSGKRVFFKVQPGRHPRITVAIAGNGFQWDDLFWYATHILPDILSIFAPALLMASLVIPIAVRRALRPLTQAATAAENIDLRSLDRRLPNDRIPMELSPFVAAINGLLQRLEAAAARQRLFTANAAHELRTPAAILTARIDALPTPDAASQTRKHELARDVDRITILLDQLLSAARMEQPDQAFGEPFDLIDLVRGLVGDFAPLAIRAGREIEFEAQSERAILVGHAQAVQGAIANVIDNALRAEPIGGTVAVSAGPAGVTVTDHGPGVPEADRELIFDPFWRKDERLRGSGLGLSIVREVIRRHHGAIEVRETPGGGATFHLALPLRADAPEFARRPQEIDAPVRVA